MKFAYVLQHSYEVGEDGAFDEVKLIGVYSSKEKAEQVIRRYKILPGFKDYPMECFHISEYEIDKDQWAEGFINGDEA
ncbi:DUF7336 domain-containing protein [Methylomusa anaerophila]|uniref:DUF7336 domain-containing protein n=1 Tax=Methylomusa anaerophila TaxID=1930071 RepID=A0A348AHB2_9FIRM|nr:hypothetical protein [Methylomusa anaerophila]BBB90460.1 hypothetical protein MAMMFC1_01111 [Methylomusa anaerophila]